MWIVAQVRTTDLVIKDPNVPLCVDLDGTFIEDETHHIALRSLLKRRFLCVCALCGLWFFKGGWHAKVFALQKGGHLKDHTFSVRKDLYAWLQGEKAKGRLLVLVTGAPYVLARKFQRQFPVFDHVLASRPGFNCVGRMKAKLLVARFGEKGFDYVGNSRKDLFIWRVARKAYGVGTSFWAKKGLYFWASRADAFYHPTGFFHSL